MWKLVIHRGDRAAVATVGALEEAGAAAAAV